MVQMWTDLKATHGPFDRLDIVAHSLGSMISIDALRTKREAFADCECRLITMGSPYRDIFNYYFPHMFPAMNSDNMPVNTMINFHRHNDFIGTRISEEPTSIREVTDGYNSHFLYFEDATLMALIDGGN